MRDEAECPHILLPTVTVRLISPFAQKPPGDVKPGAMQGMNIHAQLPHSITQEVATRFIASREPSLYITLS